MATSTINRKVQIVFVESSGQGTVSSANGYANVTLDFTPPSGGVFLGTMIRNVGASSSVNNITTLVCISDAHNQSIYRVVSTSAQTVTIYARKIYLMTH